MTKPNIRLLPTEDQTTEQATTAYLQNRYKGMSDDMAALWARAIAAEERERNKHAEMTPDLRRHVETAREKAKYLLKQGRENMIRRGFEESLRRNDFFEAAAFMNDALELGIDLNDILENTPTTLDRVALKKGEIPLSCIA
ncbi:hypothetical protein KJ657_04200 [Patescibacteria group bacterium]|nr:hypothetical protein [Patescibacteria group bacterium]MBU1016265.1 hypothetical protein [Patescibacteria group bacterium]MBU1685198.1 hypothetical protein [Patescibacteria group bacterium]MBU1938521.1 hypothetical protein [Patescibacteria group bacterium]